MFKLLTSNNTSNVVRKKQSVDPIIYKIANLDLVLEDIDKRQEVLNALLFIYQQRLKIQLTYSEELDKLSQIKFKSDTFNSLCHYENRPSFMILNRILCEISYQAEISHNLCTAISQQTVEKLSIMIETNQSSIRKLQFMTRNTQKQILSIQEKFNNIEEKFLKKAHQLMKIKTSYIANLVNPEVGFYNTNKLYLKTKDLQKEFQKAKHEYQISLRKTNEIIEAKQKNLGKMIGQLEIKQKHKMQAIQQTFLSYEKRSTERSTNSMLNAQKAITQIDTILLQMNEIISPPEKYLQNYILNQKKVHLNPAKYLNCLFQRIQSKQIDSLTQNQQVLHLRIKELLQTGEQIHKPYKKLQDSNEQVKVENQLRGQVEEEQQFHKSQILQEQLSEPVSKQLNMKKKPISQQAVVSQNSPSLAKNKNSSQMEQKIQSKSQPFSLTKKQSEKALEGINEIVNVFKKIFDNNIIPDQINLINFQRLMQESISHRKYFILCLQHFRIKGVFQIKTYKLQLIAKALNIFLGICMKKFDTFNSKNLIVLALSYFTQNKGAKLYMHQFMKKHPIWLDFGWWETALLESIYVQTKIKAQKGNNIMTIWDVKGTGLRSGNNDMQQMTFQNKVRSQLDFYVQNMNLFGFDQLKIVEYAHKYIKIFALPENIAQQILAYTQNLHRTTIIFNTDEQSQGQSSPMRILKKIRNHLMNP